MKILHTADWHLGASLHDQQDRSSEHLAFIEWFLELIKTEKPDAVIITGDIFDTRAPSNAAQELYNKFFAEIVRTRADIHVVVVGGNHDSPSLLDAPRDVYKFLNIHVVGAPRTPADDVIAINDANGTPKLLICAIPFLRSNADAFAAHYKAMTDYARCLSPDAPLLVTGHCALEGARLSDRKSERAVNHGSTITIGTIDMLPVSTIPNADYVALGHLHIQQRVAGIDTIRYSGSPIPMSFAEAGSKKYVLAVEFGIKTGDAVSVREIEVPVSRRLENIRGTIDEIRENLKKLIAANSSAWLSVSVTSGDAVLTQFWNELRTVVDKTNMRLLVTLDARPRIATATITDDISEDLDALDPQTVADYKLNSAIECHEISKTDKATYVEMIREAIATVTNSN